MIEFERRGTGLSDRVREVPTLEARMDDVRAVLAAAGSERRRCSGRSRPGRRRTLAPATLRSAWRRSSSYNAIAKGVRSPDYPYAPTAEDGGRSSRSCRPAGATTSISRVDPRAGAFPGRRCRVRRLVRSAMRTQAGAPVPRLRGRRMAMDVDIRDVLPSIRVPTLLLHRPFARGGKPVHRRTHPGRAPRRDRRAGHSVRTGGRAHRGAARLRRELLGREEPETVLATVLFTDIVGSTATRRGARRPRLAGAARAPPRDRPRRSSPLPRQRGRHRRRRLLRHLRRAGARDPLRRRDRRATVRELGLEVRAGLHTGECELDRRRRSAASPSTSARASRRCRRRARCSSRAPSRTSSPARGSASTSAASTSSRACPASGASSRSSSNRPTLRATRAKGRDDDRDGVRVTQRAVPIES